VAALYKRLRFANVQIVTLAEGKRKPLATVDAVFELAWNSVTLG
jgi:hypothetical protein